MGRGVRKEGRERHLRWWSSISTLRRDSKKWRVPFPFLTGKAVWSTYSSALNVAAVWDGDYTQIQYNPGSAWRRVTQPVLRDRFRSDGGYRGFASLLFEMLFKGRAKKRTQERCKLVQPSAVRPISPSRVMRQFCVLALIRPCASLSVTPRLLSLGQPPRLSPLAPRRGLPSNLKCATGTLLRRC